MRLVENPQNPFQTRACEWLTIPPAVERQVREEQAHTLLTCNDSPDVPFQWSVNPYRGCQHACAYCYARRTHEYLDLGAGTDFETQIVVKVNAAELLARELSRRSWRRASIAFSGVTDCYQPLESRYRITRACLAVCCERANPVGIVTKSPLVTRDLDLLVELRRRADAHVYFSAAFADEAVARVMDAGAPLPHSRFAAMRKLTEAGIPVAVLVAPVIPGLNDRDIPRILEQAAAAGATSAAYTPVRLPGNVADVFLARLRRGLPNHAARVEARIRELHGGKLNDPRFGHRMAGAGVYWESVQRLFDTTATRLHLDGGQRWRRPAPTPPAQRQLELFG